jgi:hypothetical protein
MDIKHASAWAQNFFFLFLSFFLLNKWPLKVSREYICQDFDAKEKISFDCATHVNGSEDNYGLHVGPLTSWKSHAPWLIVPSTSRYSTLELP